jgi:type IV secretory pathway TraG/TraD family ATPase VirD4
MTKTVWGRKETIIWPRHMPIYTYAVALGVSFLTFVAVCVRIHLATPLERYCLPAYERSSAFGAVMKTHKSSYRLLFVGGPHSTPRPALNDDVVLGKTDDAGGQTIPLALSDDARERGYSLLFRAPERSYIDARFSVYLRGMVYKGRPLFGFFQPPVLGGAILFLTLLPIATFKDVQRQKQLKYGRRLKGPEMLTPKQFNRTVKGDGIGFKTNHMKPMLRIPTRAEAQHMQIIGDTGAGKSALMFQVLRQVQSRGDAAIVYDPAREFVKRFYDPSRGDVILNPLDKRCPYWGPADELRSRSEARALAASLFQPPQDKKGEFFIESPQKIFAFLMAYGPTPDELVEWMSNPEEIDRRLKGTEHAHLIDSRAHQQRAGVLASLGLVADSLRLLPKLEGNGSWTATEWAEKREGWIFLTSLPAEREALRPLQSLWIDWLVLRLLNEPTQAQRRVWFVIDELASLQKLPQLHTAITEARKSRNPVVLGFQGKAQLEYLYGHLAEVMLSQPATSVWLTTKEPKAGQWVSEFIGKVEVERLRETHFDGTRAGRNFQLDRQVEPLVLESEISGLADLHAFMKYQNYVTRFSFPYFDMPVVANGFEPRERPDDKLPYQPKRTSSADPVPVELKHEPEPSAPDTSDGISEVEETEPEFALAPDDDVQNLITRG